MKRKINTSAKKAALKFAAYLEEKRKNERNKKFFREYNGKIKEEKNFIDYYYLVVCQNLTNLYFYY